jgi:hypothetical protein
MEPKATRNCRPLTKAERIAASRKEVDEATAAWHTAQIEVETIEKGIADALAPFKAALAKAKAEEEHARKAVDLAVARLGAA